MKNSLDLLDITVFLTTTQHTKKVLSKDFKLEKTQMDHRSICVAEQYLNIPRQEYRKLDKTYQKTAISLAQKVHIDTETHSVFIGQDPDKEESGLVVYQQQNPFGASQDFFDTWQTYHDLLFEFQVYRRISGFQRPPLKFCIRGLWRNDSWSQLFIANSCAFNMIPDNTIEDPFIGSSFR
jgi:hypothetical protein